jgi:sorbitol-specific phosphotransferase system component IIBC
MWHQVNSLAHVPTDRDLQLAVIDVSGTVHALVFPARRVGNSWIDSKLRRPVEVYPTHWQEWAER